MDYNNYEDNQQQEPQKRNGLEIAALVLGIIAIPLGCCYGVGAVPGLVGIILGIVSKKKGEKLSGMALAGIICSVVGILIGIAVWVFIFGVFSQYSLEELESMANTYNLFYIR